MDPIHPIRPTSPNPAAVERVKRVKRSGEDRPGERERRAPARPRAIPHPAVDPDAPFGHVEALV